MPIPNVATLYQKIGKGSEGGHEFARFLKTLLIADSKITGVRFLSESDASGDHRNVDAYILRDEHIKEIIDAFHYKFYPSRLSSAHKADIETSIKKSLSANKFIQDFIIITPEDFIKEDQVWFDKIRSEHEKKYSIDTGMGFRACQLRLHHWGHTYIVELALKHKHIGKQYFPELYPLGIGNFNFTKADLDCKNCNRERYENDGFGFHQSNLMNTFNLTNDPVFDFQFINNTSEIVLLDKIEIHIERIENIMHGFPAKHRLKSIGKIKYEIDFNTPINLIELHDPIILMAKSPTRFNLQLENFTTNAPGNYVELKFWFNFRGFSLPTNIFSLTF